MSFGVPLRFECDSRWDKTRTGKMHRGILASVSAILRRSNLSDP